MMKTLLLASASPARKATLLAAHIPPRIALADVDEDGLLTTAKARGPISAAEQVQLLAEAKAKKIAAERSKAAKQQNEELEQRERNVARRELSLKASERLSESGFPKELSELMNFSNEEAFEESYEKVTKVFRDTSKPILSGRNPANPDVDSFGFDPVREAFKPPIR